MSRQLWFRLRPCLLSPVRLSSVTWQSPWGEVAEVVEAQQEGEAQVLVEVMEVQQQGEAQVQGEVEVMGTLAVQAS